MSLDASPELSGWNATWQTLSKESSLAGPGLLNHRAESQDMDAEES